MLLWVKWEHVHLQQGTAVINILSGISKGKVLVIEVHDGEQARGKTREESPCLEELKGRDSS